MTDSLATNIAKINGMINVINILIMRSLIRSAIAFIFFNIFSTADTFADISSDILTEDRSPLSEDMPLFMLSSDRPPGSLSRPSTVATEDFDSAFSLAYSFASGSFTTSSIVCLSR